ncbi:antitoxin [Bacteroidia bacterium]|nr:antitoxin [Bacteroidia bacterium]
MDNNIKMRLYDILMAIEEIESFCIIFNNYEDYCGDLRSKRAIERNIEIIGEAMRYILKHDADFEISYARNIVDVRNRIIHGYDTVSDEIIWGIVQQHMPILKNEVENMLGE